MRRITFILLIAVWLPVPTNAQQDHIETIEPKGLESVLYKEELILHVTYPDESLTKKEHPRITAAILCITLGPFGAHRLYLGTKPIVPATYTLTLGGGIGLLPVVDLFLITFSKDISRYKNNPHVFMWVE